VTKAVSCTIGVDGCEVWIEYHAGNKRIQSVFWEIPANVLLWARVWDYNQAPGQELIFDQTDIQGSGSMNIPGNYRMIEVTENGVTYDDLPPHIQYVFNMQKTS
jgi:hypothetical protein